MDDPRFSKLFTDPKYRNVPKKERKVKIDDRFQALFKDKRFVSKVSVDKRGRPGDFSTKENYEKFYRMDTSDEDDSSDDGENAKKKETKKKGKPVREIEKAIKDPSVDYARGEAFLSDSSSGEDDSSDEEGEAKVKSGEEEAEFDKWGELDHDADTTEEATKRLAVCNMDWDRVTAQDLFLVLSSFCSPGGRLLKVSIYPSEFGKKRMAEEDALGPQELRGKQAAQEEESDEEENDADDEKDMERVRKYQINRLKYYYAVAEFNSEVAANRVYTQCDGNEYELSATKFDLRFIPDEMDFEDDPPKETCSKLPDPEAYKPKFFSTSALAMGKVDLTWDETDPERLQVMQKAFESDDIDEKALKAYLASSSSEDEDEEGGSKTVHDAEMSEEEDDEAVIAKYRALLNGVSSDAGAHEESSDENEEEGGMEMTFVPEADKRKAAIEKSVETMTPWEQYLHKKKEKRKEKRGKTKKQANSGDEEADLPSDDDFNDPFFKQDISQKPNKKGKQKKTAMKENSDAIGDSKDLSLLVMDSDDDKDHFDYKQIVKEQAQSKKAKKKAKKAGGVVEDSFKMDFDDPRFSAVFENPNYNVDPSHPSFKKTKSMQEVIEEKQKRIGKFKPNQESEEPSPKKSKAETKSSLDSLVNSVKAKSKRGKHNVKKSRH